MVKGLNFNIRKKGIQQRGLNYYRSMRRPGGDALLGVVINNEQCRGHERGGEGGWGEVDAFPLGKAVSEASVGDKNQSQFQWESEKGGGQRGGGGDN